jgi:hypothetical protein
VLPARWSWQSYSVEGLSGNTPWGNLIPRSGSLSLARSDDLVEALTSCPTWEIGVGEN